MLTSAPMYSPIVAIRGMRCSTDAVDGRNVMLLAAAEGVTLEGKSLETLARVSNGDLRKAITTLQSAVRLQGPRVRPQTVLDVAGAIPAAAVQTVMRACATNSFQAVQDAITDVIADGFGVRCPAPPSHPVIGPVGSRKDPARGSTWL